MIEREYSVKNKELDQEFDNRNLNRIEQIAIGSTPDEVAYDELSEYILSNPGLLLTPTLLNKDGNDRFKIDSRRREKEEMSATGFFNAETTFELYKKGVVPTMVLSPLDTEGRSTELRIRLKGLYSKESIPFSEEDVELYGSEIREDLQSVLVLDGVQDGHLVYKENILEREEDAA